MSSSTPVQPLTELTPTMNSSHDNLTAIEIEALAEALEPIAPAPLRHQALRERIIARAKESAPNAGFVTIAPGEGSWQSIFTGVEMKTLHDHGDAQSFLLRLAPGASVPMHTHHGDELCMVLEGTVQLDDVEASAGTFHLAQAGSKHQSVTTKTGCLLYLRANLDTSIRF